MKTLIAYFTQKRVSEGTMRCNRQGDEEGEQYTLYLHRGAFEPILSEEDEELDPDRWCSHSACGQVISQWIWNLRLKLGHQLHPDPVRTTEFAPVLSPPPTSGYAPPQVGLS